MKSKTTLSIIFTLAIAFVCGFNAGAQDAGPVLAAAYVTPSVGDPQDFVIIPGRATQSVETSTYPEPFKQDGIWQWEVTSVDKQDHAGSEAKFTWEVGGTSTCYFTALEYNRVLETENPDYQYTPSANHFNLSLVGSDVLKCMRSAYKENECLTVYRNGEIWLQLQGVPNGNHVYPVVGFNETTGRTEVLYLISQTNTQQLAADFMSVINEQIAYGDKGGTYFYQMRWDRLDLNGGSTYGSYGTTNYLNANNYAVDATVRACHRQGHPYPFEGKVDEIIHNEIAFTPIAQDKVPANETIYYAIMRNGVTIDVMSQNEAIELAGVGEVVYQDNVPSTVYGYGLFNEGEVHYGVNPTFKYYYNVVVVRVPQGNTYVPAVGDTTFPTNLNSYGSADLLAQYTGEIGENTEMLYYAKVSNRASVFAHNTQVIRLEYGIEFGAARAYRGLDVTANQFASSMLYGEFVTERDANGQVVATEVKPMTETTKYSNTGGYGEQWTYKPTIYINLQEKYPALYAELEALRTTDKDAYNAKWLEVSQIIWDKEVPINVFLELTFEDNGQQYKLYSDWASIDPGQAGGNGGWTAVDDIKGDNTRVSVYPNPATDYITVEGASGNVALFSAAGAQVAGVNGQGAVTIDVTGLAKGVYILKAGNVTEKILIK